MKKTANQISWDVLLKCAAVDERVKQALRRVAKMRGLPTPSDKDIEKMFPPGWEEKLRQAGHVPTWQAQYENSRWAVNDATSSHVRDYAASRSSSTPRASGQGFWGNMSLEDKIHLGIMAAAILGTAAYGYYDYRSTKKEQEKKRERRESRER